MTNKISFEQILREKIQSFPSENREKSPISGPKVQAAETVFSADVSHQKIDFETVIFPQKKYSRLASLMPKKLENTVFASEKELLLEVKHLPMSAFVSLELLKKLGANELSSSEISLSEVKKAFRRLCLVYHPDHQSAELSPAVLEEKSLLFAQLKTAKDDLEEYFSLYREQNKAA